VIKSVLVFSRRADFPAEDFSKRWLEDHGALVRKHAKALRIRRYIQSHRLQSDKLGEFNGPRGWPQSKFDGLAEVWLDSIEDFHAALASPEGQAASQELARDEAEFIDPSSVQMFLSALSFDRALATGDFDSVYQDDLVSWHSFTNKTVTKAESLALVASFFAGFQQKGYSRPRYTQIRRIYTDKGFIQQHVVEATRGDQVFRMPACMVIEVRDGKIAKQEEYLDPSPYARLMEQA
jgi:uncharacterized protein (TIGR02118 family)